MAFAAKYWRRRVSRLSRARCSNVFDSIFRDEHGRAQYHYVLIDYFCRLTSGEAKAGSDVSEVRWVQEGELPGMGLRDSIEQVVRQGLTRVRQNIS